jgi:hypothetical protein
MGTGSRTVIVHLAIAARRVMKVTVMFLLMVSIRRQKTLGKMIAVFLERIRRISDICTEHCR